MDNDSITAIHEAAHAVASIRSGLIFDHVTAEPDDVLDIDGALHWSSLMVTGAMEAPAELVAIVLIAGPCAEAKYRKLRIDRVFMGEAALDDRMAIAELGLSEDEFLAATRAAIDIVDVNWPLIERVGAALLERGTLTFDQVAALVD
jgi:hypothetical protein